jgi:hypothetical protein
MTHRGADHSQSVFALKYQPLVRRIRMAQLGSYRVESGQKCRPRCDVRPAQLGDLARQVMVLNLAHNKIETLPPDLKSLLLLKELYVEYVAARCWPPQSSPWAAGDASLTHAPGTMRWRSSRQRSARSAACEYSSASTSGKCRAAPHRTEPLPPFLLLVWATTNSHIFLARSAAVRCWRSSSHTTISSPRSL